ncbi:hypothetical protein P3S67_006559 [Capsicum chacoense]
MTYLRKKNHAKYIVQGNSSTLEIYNDMTVKLFIEILKAEFIFGKYPRCITTSDFVIDSDVVDADDLMIEFYDFVKPSGLAVAEVDSVESLEIGNVGGVELISDCYNSVVNVNQKYTNKATLVSVMRNYAIKHRFNFRAEKSDKQSYVLLCKLLECSWVFKASCKHGRDTFIVRTFNDEHTFSIMDRVFEQQHATIAFLAGLTTSKLVNSKRIITPSDIIEDIKRELGLDIDYMKAWRAKERALKILRGRPADGYKKLPAYIYMPVVVVDGSHMRGPYQGTFVLASTIDGAAYKLDDFDELMCKVGKIDNRVKIRESSSYIYGVYEEGRKYIVQLVNRTCNCGRFQLNEIPCAHAIAVLKSKHVKEMKS